ncbi:MAG: ABC transporter ATP-binding protein [Methanocellales archaeon]
MPLLEVSNISKSFGGIKAVKNVSFTIEEGEIVGLIGPNGSGKTTLFNLINGIYPPNDGKIYFQGKDITNLKPHERCELGIGRTFQIVKPFLNMTALENVAVGALFGGKSVKSERDANKKAWEILELVGIAHKASSLARDLTLTEQKRLELAKALATEPKLLLLDEVVAGLSPAAAIEAMNLVKKVHETGVTVFVIDHVLRAVMGFSDRVIVLDQGEKIAEGKPEEIANDRRVIEAYLGERYIL